MPVGLKDPLPYFVAVGSGLAVLKSDILRDVLCTVAEQKAFPFQSLPLKTPKIWCRIWCWAAETPVPYKNGAFANCARL